MKDFCNFNINEGQITNDRFYKGFINRHLLNRGLEYFNFQFKCYNDFTLNLQSNIDSHIYICINLSDRKSIALECCDDLILIPPFASLLIPFKNANKLQFLGEQSKSYDFIILKIDCSHLDDEQMSLLQSLQDSDPFIELKDSDLLLIPNLGICEMARKLKNIDKSVCENKFIASGYGNILIGLKLKELTHYQQFSSKFALLNEFEIYQLNLLTEKIKTDPQNPYAINDLCRMTGLSVAKLQSGFKHMHDCTVAIFIRDVRLDKALELLKNTDLNVSEIVYSIGLNSRSYFCRIFKDRYKCSPKNYQQKLRNVLSTAS